MFDHYNKLISNKNLEFASLHVFYPYSDDTNYIHSSFFGLTKSTFCSLWN